MVYDKICIAQDFWPYSLECVRGICGQLEGLNSFLVPLNKSEVSWFNGNFANIPHKAAKPHP